MNYFFYDGLYWVFIDDYWYASDWYNGPWDIVEPYYVPLYILRVPVRYYRHPPFYFRVWQAGAPPRWGEHWGRDWEERRSGWNRWDQRSVPAPAPLPAYQRQYSGERYPRDVEQQHSIRSENYRYQPREEVTQQHFKQRQQQQDQQRGQQDQQRQQQQEQQRGQQDQQRQQQQEQQRGQDGQQRQQQQEQQRGQDEQQQGPQLQQQRGQHKQNKDRDSKDEGRGQDRR